MKHNTIYIKRLTSNLMNIKHKITVPSKDFRIFLWLFQWTIGMNKSVAND